MRNALFDAGDTRINLVHVPCIDARHAKAVLKLQINKSDRNDAVGIARIMQTGWFKEVRVGGQQLRDGLGFYEISGLAWSGHGRIRRVDVSADGGRNWREAQLQQPILSKALTRFRLPWQWDGTPALLQSRAIDDTGYVQPRHDATSQRDAAAGGDGEADAGVPRSADLAHRPRQPLDGDQRPWLWCGRL